jgi:hypothetical protein
MGRAAPPAKPLLVALTALAALAGAGPWKQGRACSCTNDPAFQLITPGLVDAAPPNTKIRAAVPAGPGTLVLRTDRGDEVPSTTRAFKTGGGVDLVELTPRAPLAPSTRYQVAFINPARHPSTVVFGLFRTGTAPDTAPPRFEPVGKATGHRVNDAQGSACEVEGPWVEIENVRANDPGRADARLTFGVWLGDAAGRIDASKPPTGMFLLGKEGPLVVGRDSLCSSSDFPFPKGGGPLSLGVAALDEAGNASAMQRVNVAIPGGAP